MGNLSQTKRKSLLKLLLLWKRSLMKDQPPSAGRLIGSSQIHISCCGLGLFIVPPQESGVSEGYPPARWRQWVALTQASYRTYQTLSKKFAQNLLWKKIALKWRVCKRSMRAGGPTIWHGKNVPLCFFFFFSHSFHPIHKEIKEWISERRWNEAWEQSMEQQQTVLQASIFPLCIERRGIIVVDRV